jgi:hypothetical protein
MNPWEIPAEAVIYSRAKESCAPVLACVFQYDMEHTRNTSTNCVIHFFIRHLGSGIMLAGERSGLPDAHRDDGKRFVVRAAEKLTVFVELEAI